MEIANRILQTILVIMLEYGALIVYMMNVPRLLHYAQLEGYGLRDYIRWITKHPKLAFKAEIPQFIACVGVYFIILMINYFGMIHLRNEQIEGIILVEIFTLLLVYMIPNIVKAMRERKIRKHSKKKLVYTGRAKRLMFWSFFTVVLLEYTFMPQHDSTYMVFLMKPLTYSFLTLVGCVNMIFALFLSIPTEGMIKNSYIRKAKWKLWKKDYRNLIKIGITGSYGKTSTKFILQSILSEKYRVLATPESYNTTMGNVKVIREMLNKDHEVFISEMGARYQLEIAEICEFVKPQIGIITSIGPQHLETFKSIKNVVKAKSELLKMLPRDGAVFLPNDQSYCLELYQKEFRKKYLYALNDKKADVYAKNIQTSTEGITFTAVTSLGEIKCHSKLLGEHNVQNILGCIAIAIHLGLDKEQIARGIEKIKPVEHRLQIIHNPNNVTVIDDAFNSNPEGSKAALKVLNEFDGRKIIITPGMVELGTEETKYNREFGRAMADVVDVAILVGVQRSKAIVEGLKEKQFSEMNLYVVDSLKSATKKLGEISKPGDVVLFENDLPDNYNEQ